MDSYKYVQWSKIKDSRAGLKNEAILITWYKHTNAFLSTWNEYLAGSFTTLFAAIGWFALYVPSLYMQNETANVNDSLQAISCLLPSISASKMLQLIVAFEGQGQIKI